MAKESLFNRVLGKSRPEVSLKHVFDKLMEAEKFSIEIADTGMEINQHLAELNTTIDNLNDQLTDNDSAKADINAQIIETENRLNSLKDELLSVQSHKEKIDNEMEVTIASVGETNERLQATKAHFSESKTRVEKARSNWKETIEKSRYSEGADAGPIPVCEKIAQFNNVSFLGDLHGWAPGLIHAMQDLDIGKVSIGGWDLRESAAMTDVFPNNLERSRKQLPLAKVGLDGHPWKPGAPPTRYMGIGWTPNYGSTEALIQVGDLFDRGDYGDVILEIMRQCVIANPGRVGFIVGNHEVWVIEDNSDVWLKNEANYVMQPGSRTPGVCYHDPLMSGVEDYDASMMAGFRVLEGGLGALLLAQFVAFHDALPDEQKEAYMAQFEDAIQALPMKMNGLHKLVHQGGWKLHEIGRQAIEIWRKKSQAKPIAIPGAFVMLSIGGAVTAHAEANGLDASDVVLESLNTTWEIAGKEVHWIPLVLNKGKGLNRPLYEARTERDQDGWKDSIQSGLEKLRKYIKFGVYVHGHSVRQMPDEHEFALEDGSQVLVAGIDEGMTPHYRHRVEDDAMDPNRRAKLFNYRF